MNVASDKGIEYFEIQFSEIRKELSMHSMLLNTMNDSILKVIEIMRSVYLEGSLNQYQEPNKIQDSTGAIPSELILANKNERGEEQVRFNLRNEVKSNKRETPSFGRVTTYVSNPKNEHNTPQFKETLPKNDIEEICIDSLDSSSDESNINSVFSPYQENLSSKHLIIEPIDIEFQDISNKAKFEKTLIRCNNTRRIINSVNVQGTTRNKTPYSAISFNIKNGSARIRANQDLKKIKFHSKVPNSTARSRLFESFSYLDKTLNRKLLRSPDNRRVKVNFQKTITVKCDKDKAKTNISLSSIEILPAKCFYIITRYLGHELSPLIFSSKTIMLKYLPYRAEQLEKVLKKLEKQYKRLVLFKVIHRKLVVRLPCHRT